MDLPAAGWANAITGVSKLRNLCREEYNWLNLDNLRLRLVAREISFKSSNNCADDLSHAIWTDRVTISFRTLVWMITGVIVFKRDCVFDWMEDCDRFLLSFLFFFFFLFGKEKEEGWGNGYWRIVFLRIFSCILIFICIWIAVRGKEWRD